MRKLWALLVLCMLVFLVAHDRPEGGQQRNQALALSPTVPTAAGWGGTQLDEAAANSGNAASSVFTGEGASNMEMQMRRLQSLGLTIIRVSWNTGCPGMQEMGPYSTSNLQRAISLAQFYNLWLIVDDHGYDDMQSGNVSCWLSFWSPIVAQFKGSYNNLIWEPENEPRGIDVPTLSSAYQQWINQARNLGDTHWIVVQNLCSYGCGFGDMSQGYPTVTDSLNKILISLHSYHYYSQFSGSWDNATSEGDAQVWFQAVLAGVKNTGWQPLNTEGGADNGCTLCAPDTVLPGSAGYSIVTLHFVQTLTSLYNLNHISWVWWADGSWTDTPCAGIYGALQPNRCPGGSGYSGGVGWGNLISSPVPCVVSCGPAPLVASFTYTPLNPLAQVTVSFTGTAVGGTQPYSYAWDFGDSGVSSGGQTSHSYSQAGTYMVRLTVTDSVSSLGQAQGTIIVGGVPGTNTAPVLSVPGLQTVQATLPVAFMVQASDTDSDPLITLSTSPLPTGSTFTGTSGNPATGIFSWIPSNSQASANFTITFFADDGHGGTTGASVIVQVKSHISPPVLNLPGPLTATVGQTISFTVTATLSSPQSPVTLSASGLVAGMSFDQVIGAFSFTPDQSQTGKTFNVTFLAMDHGSPPLSDSKDESIRVTDVSSGPSGGTNGGGNGSGCIVCGILPQFSPSLVLLGLGGVLGMTFSFVAFFLRARGHRDQARY